VADPDDFDLAGFDEAYNPDDFATDTPANVGDGMAEEGDFLDYTQRTTIPGTNITGFISPQSYMEYRGATPTNPFPDSIFSRIFGAENVSYVDPQTGRGMGGMDLAGINNLRYRQAMGLPSLKTGENYKMGDFYIGQPTMEGTVREVPRGGIMDMIPGLSTITNMLGRNRGLPESSEAYRRAVADANQRSANVSNFFQPLTDLITGGIESLRGAFTAPQQKDPVTDRPIPRGIEMGDMTTANAFIPDARVVVDNFASPVSKLDTTITDDGANLNTGIANVAPTMSNQANMAVADALQLIPQGTLADSIGVRNQVAQALNPELKAFIDRQPSIEQRLAELQKQRQREQNFREDVINSIQNRNTGILNQNFINRTLNPVPFDDSGTFINLDNI
tara:strand:- start:602 stop:1774 length:1173 start_codon:yes stop_codon:yes gene_type:complete